MHPKVISSHQDPCWYLEMFARGEGTEPLGFMITPISEHTYEFQLSTAMASSSWKCMCMNKRLWAFTKVVRSVLFPPKFLENMIRLATILPLQLHLQTPHNVFSDNMKLLLDSRRRRALPRILACALATSSHRDGLPLLSGSALFWKYPSHHPSAL